ncbi:dTDP-4-amino-4,6-dideoxygalactose transaminase [Polynucleobacter sp. IMCC 29146]|nr:dTDP-4-amino-4,6-dideoxygalactose transaminase [Polynucleobacter sp. IMCC 29146]
MTGNELDYIRLAHHNLRLAGDGEFTKKSQEMIASSLSAKGSAFLTHSCTAALEIAAIATNIKPGDEIIMPSFTFVSTANAFVLRGGIPIFVDIRPDTQNINEDLIENAISKKTRAIVPVHYAGVSCEMDKIKKIAKDNDLFLIEDAAQGYLSKYKNNYLGTIGDYGALSFHETKNIISGEGGSILVNHPSNLKKIEVIREKGTNRSGFFRGEVAKYTWKNIGSSFLPSEITAAFLCAQIEKGLEITKNRENTWRQYHQQLESLEESGLLKRPVIPKECLSNSHIYYVVLDNKIDRERTLEAMNNKGVNAVSHYVPLHSSPAGKKFGKFSGSMNITNRQANSLIRLPLWVGMSNNEINHVVRVLKNSIKI